MGKDPGDLSAERAEAERHYADFRRRRDDGEALDLSGVCASYPELAPELRALDQQWRYLQELLPSAVPAVMPPDALSSVVRAQESSTVPRQLGDYRILRDIGRGGMGVVYEAEEITLGRHVALKVLPAQAMLDGRVLERFRREAQAAGRLHHPNIVPVFGVGEHEGVPFYTMQFIEGDSLDKVIHKSRQLREAQDQPPSTNSSSGTDSSAERFRSLARLGLQVAEALAYAHGEGVVHRDIKPSNLILDPSGTVWVTESSSSTAVSPRTSIVIV